MHNFVKSSKTIHEAMEAVKRGSHKGTRTFIETHEAELKKLYDDYDNKAVNHQLELLKPYWEEKTGDSEAEKKQKANNRKSAHDLFVHRKYYNDLWEELKRLNGGKILKCPICGVENCKDIDHYVPRDEEQMPEYSVHYSNLIPTCHNCNNNKGTLFLSSSKKRLVFNAYYDNIVGKEILMCVICKSPIDSQPMVTIKQSPTLDPTDYVDSIVISTLGLKSLGLMEKFQEVLEENLKKELVRLYERKGDNWDKISDDYLKYVKSGAFNFLEVLLFREMSSSQIVHDWFVAL